MSLKGWDGMDTYTSFSGGNHNFGSDWLGSFTGVRNTIVTNGGRFGGGCITLGGSGNGEYFYGELAAATAFKMGGSAKCSIGNDTSNAYNNFMAVWEDAPSTTSRSHLAIGINSSNQCVLYRSGTTLATSTAITGLLNNYHHFEFVGTIADSGGTAQLYVDGVKVIDFTGDTKNAGSGVINHCMWGSNNSNNNAENNRWDDVAWGDDATPFGEWRIDTLPPTADTASADFTTSAGSSHFALVDELPSNGDTDYVKDQVTGHKDLYTMGDLPTSSATIGGVKPVIVARKDDVGTINLKTKLKSGSTTADGSSTALQQTNYTIVAAYYLIDPDTSAAWTDSGVNGISVGQEIA